MANDTADESRERRRDDRYDRERDRKDDHAARDSRSHHRRRRSPSQERDKHDGDDERRHRRHRTRRHRDASADPPHRSRSPRRSDHKRERSPHRSKRHADNDRPSRHHRSRHSPSRSPHRPSASRSPSPAPLRSRAPLPSQESSYRGDPTAAVVPAKPKEKPNFHSTGLLAAESNRVTIGAGLAATNITLKYHEPPEARKPPPSQPWALFVFEHGDAEPLETVALHRRSCWLLGRDARVTDLPVEHPSCSGQHAVLQFRFTSRTDEFGERRDKVGLYVLDLESEGGTRLNGRRVEAARYVQCLSGDVLTLGKSSQEFVVILPPKS